MTAKKSLQNKNKLIAILMVVVVVMASIIFPRPVYCAAENIFQIAEDLNDTIVSELDEIDFTCLNKVVEDFHKNNTNFFSLDNIKTKIHSIISGKSAVNYSSFFASLFSTLIEKILSFLPILSLLIAIGVLSNLLGGIKSKFNEKSTGNLIHLVCFLASAVLIIGMISNLSNTTSKAISGMVDLMNVLFPILLTLMIGTGSGATAGVYQPIVAIISTYVADFFKFFIIPLFMISFVFGLISNFSDNVKLDKFSSFINSLFKWSVGLIFTLFFAVFTIQGITAGKFDSLSIRTTKYTIKSYIPIMGGYLSDGMDLILSSTILIKNSIGLVGVFMIISTILSPIIEIALFSLVLKLISAVLQPMGNNKISNFLSSTSKSVTMLSTSIIAIGFMYLLLVGLVITTGAVVW